MQRGSRLGFEISQIQRLKEAVSRFVGEHKRILIIVVICLSIPIFLFRMEIQRFIVLSIIQIQTGCRSFVKETLLPTAAVCSFSVSLVLGLLGFAWGKSGRGNIPGIPGFHERNSVMIAYTFFAVVLGLLSWLVGWGLQSIFLANPYYSAAITVVFWAFYWGMLSRTFGYDIHHSDLVFFGSAFILGIAWAYFLGFKFELWLP
jgi:cobalamin synthase